MFMSSFALYTQNEGLMAQLLLGLAAAGQSYSSLGLLFFSEELFTL
jgi:hypothetical protein